MARNLSGKVIAITGASSGIGAATALECAAAQMDVALFARRRQPMDDLARQIEQLGRRAIVVEGDVDHDDDVARFIEETVSRLGNLDVAFANAGYGLYGSVAQTSDEQARSIFETNFFGTLRLVRHAAEVMRKQGSGHVLICTSAVSEIGLPMFGMYCATKAAQDSIASALRAELADEGVFVSSVHPVGTRTDFYETAQQRSKQSASGFNTPAPMMQTPQKVAQCIVKCLRKPKAEVWPHPFTRIGLAIVTAVPFFNAMSMRRLMRTRFVSDNGGDGRP